MITLCLRSAYSVVCSSWLVQSFGGLHVVGNCKHEQRVVRVLRIFHARHMISERELKCNMGRLPNRRPKFRVRLTPYGFAKVDAYMYTYIYIYIRQVLNKTFLNIVSFVFQRLSLHTPPVITVVCVPSSSWSLCQLAKSG